MSLTEECSEMAQFTINFSIDSAREGNQDPYYRVQILTGLMGSPPASVDGDLLLIERKSSASGQIDVFYGIVKAVDFSSIRKASPYPGQTMYRAHSWSLVFYNQKTMEEAIALMKAQIDVLAQDVDVYVKSINPRTETYISKNF